MDQLIEFINRSETKSALKEFEKVKDRVNQAKCKTIWEEILKSDECYAEILVLPKEHRDTGSCIQTNMQNSLSEFTIVEREFRKALIHAPRILVMALESINKNYFQAYSELRSWANEGVHILQKVSELKPN
ncbi:MAG: hypothetical protein WC087_01840 [Candidatus Paceibacterota bacterium]